MASAEYLEHGDIAEYLHPKGASYSDAHKRLYKIHRVLPNRHLKYSSNRLGASGISLIFWCGEFRKASDTRLLAARLTGEKIY
jgi:hypothetical protein